jgi:hypothetical protein
MRELPSRSSHVPVSISLDFCPAGCRVVHRSHGSLVFRWQGAVKDGPKGRRLWRSRSLTAPCRRKILIHALDGRGLDGRLIVRRCLLAPRVGKGPVARRGAKGAARCIILYRLSRKDAKDAFIHDPKCRYSREHPNPTPSPKASKTRRHLLSSLALDL